MGNNDLFDDRNIIDDALNNPGESSAEINLDCVPEPEPVKRRSVFPFVIFSAILLIAAGTFIFALSGGFGDNNESVSPNATSSSRINSDSRDEKTDKDNNGENRHDNNLSHAEISTTISSAEVTTVSVTANTVGQTTLGGSAVTTAVQTTIAKSTTTAKPAATTARPVATTAKPAATTAKPAATTAKPAVTTAKPTTTAAAVVTTAQLGWEQTKTQYINRVVELVNIERAAVGYPALTLNSQLTACANIRAEEIVQSFSHTRPNGSTCFTVVEEAGITWYALGENIAAGHRNPEEVMDGWMNSEGHRNNILSNNDPNYFNSIGIGVCNDGGTLYWVQIFAKM